MLHSYTEHPSQEEEMNITAESLGMTCLEQKDYKITLATGSQSSTSSHAQGS